MPKPKPQRRHEAAERQRSYDAYVNDLVSRSSPKVAQEYFDTLSESQRTRILNDPAFDHLTWLEFYRDPTNAGASR